MSYLISTSAMEAIDAMKSFPQPSNKLLTATLESSLHHLDSLRREIEKAGRKNIRDVREIGGIGSDLLAAYENTIDYYDLVDLINEMRDGIAKRRAAALGVLA